MNRRASPAAVVDGITGTADYSFMAKSGRLLNDDLRDDPQWGERRCR